MIDEIDISSGWMWYKYTSDKNKTHLLYVEFDSEVIQSFLPATYDHPSEGSTEVKVRISTVSAYLELWDYSREIKPSKEFARDLKEVIKEYINEN